MSKPLWSDGQIDEYAKQHSASAGLLFRDNAYRLITQSLRDMRDEYEAEVTRLRAKLDTATTVADAINEMAGMAIPPKSVRPARIIVGEDS